MEVVNGASIIERVVGVTDNSVETEAAACRKELAKFVILSRLPFSVVEGVSFKDVCKILRPHLIIPSKKIVARECFRIYLREKLKLKAYFQFDCSRLALTTECWTSSKNLSYVSLTAHFIDTEEKYQKRIISFSVVPDHMSDTIGPKLEESLRDWGLRNMSKVKIDPASSNDVAALVKDILAMTDSSVALESIFTGRVRVLDSYRSSLSPKIAEALICSENWLKPAEEFEFVEGDVSGLIIWRWEVAAGVVPTTQSQPSGCG